jgi:disulfide bond formation protein DsbB
MVSADIGSIGRTYDIAFHLQALYVGVMRLTRALSWSLSKWPLIALATSLAMLAAAHSFEKFGNMPPCALCLHQREAYWAAVAVSLLSLIVGKFRPDPLSQRAFGLLLMCAFGAGALTAGFHVGVELKWWPGLAECAGGGKYNVSGDILGALSQSMDVPACDKVAWSLFGISMAGWNMLVSLGLVVLSALSIVFPEGFKEKTNV